MPGRGELTPDIQAKAFDLFGREITIRELRLMPYVATVMINNRIIEPVKINAEERVILSQWRQEGHIEGGASGLAITKDFWDKINELLFWSYVAYDN